MTIIREPEVDVQARRSTDNPTATDHQPAEVTTGAASLFSPANEVSNTSCPRSEERHLLAKELKEEVSFRRLMEADRHQFKTGGTSYQMCCCPFHPDRTPSFCVYEADDYARCYGCDWHGDILTYEMDFHRCDFLTALDRLNDFFYHHPRAGRKAKAAPKKDKAVGPALTDKQVAERKKYAERLATDAGIAGEICRKRLERSGETWNPDTLQKLAREGSLGWAPDALAFIYPTGTKYRQWPEKKFFWECDGLSLWRAHRLTDAHHVYLTESETDAIAMLDAGVEEKMPGVAVVAAPSATTFKSDWAAWFRGKKVTLCFDDDEAGRKGADRVAALIRPYATEILTFNLGEVGK